MDNIVRIDFDERDQVWEVTLWHADAKVTKGEPFPASGHERFSKLEQVLNRLNYLGYIPVRISYDNAQQFHYSFEIKPTGT